MLGKDSEPEGTSTPPGESFYDKAADIPVTSEITEKINQHSDNIHSHGMSEPSTGSDSFFNPEAVEFNQNFENLGSDLSGGRNFAAHYDPSHPFVANSREAVQARESPPSRGSFVAPEKMPDYQTAHTPAMPAQRQSLASQGETERQDEVDQRKPPPVSNSPPAEKEEEKEALEQIPDCDVKRYVLAVGKTINKTEEQLHPILSMLIRQNWLETIDHLNGLSDSDWDQLELPRQLVKLLRQYLPEARSLIQERPSVSPYQVPKARSAINNAIAQIAAAHNVYPSGSLLSPGVDYSAYGRPGLNSQGFSGEGPSVSSPSSRPTANLRGSVQQHLSPLCRPESARDRGSSANENEVEQFVRRVCERHERSQAELHAAIQCLVEDNWFDSLDQLRALTQAQWEVLELPIGLTSLLPAALASDGEEEESIESLMLEAGTAMGRTGPQLDMTISRLRQHGFHTAASLQTLSEADWSNLRLPLRLLEEIQKLLSERYPSSYRASLGSPPSSPDRSQLGLSSYQFNSPGLPGNTSLSPSRFQAIPDPRIVADKESREKRLMSVDRFLLKMGLSVGRTEAEMEPVIQRIVKDNWLDSMPALRSLKPDEWGSLGLPKRLIDAIRHGLSDPFSLELNTVQFTNPEPELFPCDAIAAVWKLEGEIPPQCLPDTLRSLLKLMETILCNPFDEAKRIIRKSNANFQKRAGQYKSGLLVLEAVGYEDAIECYLLPVAYITRITEAHAALAQVAQLHRDRLSKNKKFSKLFSSIKKV